MGCLRLSDCESGLLGSRLQRHRTKPWAAYRPTGGRSSIDCMASSASKHPSARVLALAGALGSLAVDGLYLAAIAQQGVTPPGGRFVFVASWIAAAGTLALIGAVVHQPAWQATLLGLAAAMLFTLAVPAIFSFGIPLMLCAALVGIPALRAGELAQLPRWVGLVGPLGLVLLAGLSVAAGFAVTDF